MAETVGASQGVASRSLPSDQFYALTSAIKGCGRRMVEAVLAATPEEWFVAIPMDWSGGFWQRMADEYPRRQVS